MTGLTWDAETLATGAQLLLAATLAVHVLVVRPRAARENLALTARVIGDDVTLDQNHGLLPVRDAEVERVRQLVARLVQDPATAKNVLLAADAELGAERDEPSLDRIRVEAYLTRLTDACSRYLHDAWPLNGTAQDARHAYRLSSGPLASAPLEVEPAVEADHDLADEIIDLGEVEPRRIDLDAAEKAAEESDPFATVERPAVLAVPAQATSQEDFDLDGRRITTHARVRIDLNRLKQKGSAPTMPARWQKPQAGE